MNRRLLSLLASVALVASASGASPYSEIWQRLYNNGELFDETLPQNAPTADSDGDGWNTLTESIAGTDPKRSDSPSGFVRLIITPHPESAALFTLRFPSFIGKQYQLSVSSNLTDWTPFGDSIEGAGEEIELAVDATDDDNHQPEKLFWRVSISDFPSRDEPDLTAYEQNILSLHPEFSTGGGGGGTGGGTVGNPAVEGYPDSDGDGIVDPYDGARTEPLMRWGKALECKYLWVPVNGGGYKAVDINDRGQVLLKNPQLPLTDYKTQPIAKVWDANNPESAPTTDVFFQPEAFSLWMMKGDDYSVDAEHIEHVTYARHLEAAKIIPKNDPDAAMIDKTLITVTAHSIGDDGSVMANVNYEVDKHYGMGSESATETHVITDLVFLWGANNYGTCKMLGTDRGFFQDQGTTSNFATGFYNDASHKTNAVVFDQEHSSRPADHGFSRLALKSYPITGGLPGSPAELSGETSCKWDTFGDFNPRDLTASGRTIFSRNLPDSGAPGGVAFRYVIGGTESHQLLPQGGYFDTITDLPVVSGGAKWGLGILSEKLRMWNGTGYDQSQESNLLLFDKTGVAIGDGADGHDLWRDGRWISFKEATGRSEDLPSGLKPRKVTSGGIIWMSNEEGTDNGLLVPIVVVDNAFARGVDNVSTNVLQNVTDPDNPPAVIPNKGYQSKIWVMAPDGGTPYNNLSRVYSPFMPDQQITISGGGFKTDPATINLGSGRSPWVRWLGTGTGSADVIPTIKFGNQPTGESPIGVKFMKKRKLRISVFPVVQTGSPSWQYTLNSENQSTIKEWLTEVYAYQINVWPEVTFKSPTNVAYDPDHTGTLSYPSEAHSTLMASCQDAGADVIVLLLMSPVDYIATGDHVIGLAPWINSNDDYKPVVICTSKLNDVSHPEKGLSNMRIGEVAEVMAHEVGHRVFGTGHPDKGNGPAPLIGSRTGVRLMVAGTKHPAGPKLVVKAEWDWAEEWLQRKPTRDE